MSDEDDEGDQTRFLLIPVAKEAGDPCLNFFVMFALHSSSHSHTGEEFPQQLPAAMIFDDDSSLPFEDLEAQHSLFGSIAICWEWIELWSPWQRAQAVFQPTSKGGQFPVAAPLIEARS